MDADYGMLQIGPLQEKTEWGHSAPPPPPPPPPPSPGTPGGFWPAMHDIVIDKTEDPNGIKGGVRL